MEDTETPSSEAPARRALLAPAATLVLVTGLAFMAGWGLRGAFSIERIEPDEPRSIEAALDTNAAPPTARADTQWVSPEEAGRARPGSPPVPDANPGALVMPVDGVRPEDLVDTYASARGEGRTHDAIDIIAPRGTPVRAAAAGRVLRLFISERGGLTIYVLTGRDQRTVHYYAHLDAYVRGLTAGSPVTAGQMIGTVGDTGNAAPGNTHLHFAIWHTADPADFWTGDPVNPYPLLRGEGVGSRR